MIIGKRLKEQFPPQVKLVSTFPQVSFHKDYQCSDELKEERIVKVLEFESKIQIEIV